MKFFYITLCCLVATQFTYGQATVGKKPFSDKTWFAMNGGLTIPVGDFGDDNINSAEAGLAKMGVVGKLDLGIKVYRSLGICISGVLGQNQINEKGFDNATPNTNGVVEDITTKPWKYIGGMGGLYMTTAIGKGALVLKGQVGYASVSSYSLQWLLSRGSQYARLEVGSVKSGAGVIDFGVMGMIPIYDNTFFSIGLDYFNTTLKFKGIPISQEASGAKPVYSSFDYSMNIKLITLNIGVVCQL